MALLLPAFALVLMAAWTGAEAVAPEITDTDFHFRLHIVQAAQAEHPDRPLGIMLGSSRTVFAFRPEQLTEADGVYWVNASQFGAGPVLNRLILRRYLRAGVRPAVVVLEVMPRFFVKEDDRVVTGHMAVTEFPFARRYSGGPFDYDYHFLRQRVTRAGDLGRVARPFAGRVAPLPRGGYRLLRDDVPPEERARATTWAHNMNADPLRSMAARPAADRAFRDTLREAAGHGVRVVLLRSAEGPVFRSWYDPAGLAAFDAYVARVADEFGTPVIDARLWLEEGDFYDSHHVLKRGAEKFTARLAHKMATITAR